tara:strand:+ start:4983 stop:5201 length:219 start_codon:yes stop_codon:yes gene_type:complete
MSGHNALFELTEDQQGTAFEGGPFVVFGSGAPGGSTTGSGKGALYINTAGGAGTTIYVNVGTASSPNWDSLT